MKKLILFLLLAPVFAYAQLPQNDRWTLLYESPKTNEKTYIDTQTITTQDYFDGHEKVYLIWLRTYRDLSGDKYSERNDSHMAFDLALSQLEIKSVTKYKDGNVIDSQQAKNWNWIDIVPESNGELVLNYLKKLGK